MTGPAAGEVATLSWTDWPTLLGGLARARLEAEVLPAFIVRQRWFGGKTRRVTAVSLADAAPLVADRAVLTLVRVAYADGGEEMYVLPLAVAVGQEAAALLAQSPAAVLARIGASRGEATEAGVLHDGVFAPEVRRALLDAIDGARVLDAGHGRIVGRPGARLPELMGGPAQALDSRLGHAEQSNTSIRYGERLMLKMFRRPSEGENPECEVTALLTDLARFPAIAPFGGSLEYERAGRAHTTLAVLQGFVLNQGDAWSWMLGELARLLEAAAPAGDRPPPREDALLAAWLSGEVSPPDAAAMGASLDAAAQLGRRTGEMHAALAVPRGLPAFDPEPAGPSDLARLADAMSADAAKVLASLDAHRARVPEAASALAERVLASRDGVARVFGAVRGVQGPVVRTRIHGDYHLGQVLRTRADFVIVDFEGEPARPLAERRAKHSPIKDVAGMLRSFAYAAASARAASPPGHDAGDRAGLVTRWLAAAGASFLRAYRDTAAASGLVLCDEKAFVALLRAYLLDKALYELQYELDNRPSWVAIPLHGVLAGVLET